MTAVPAEIPSIQKPSFASVVAASRANPKAKSVNTSQSPEANLTISGPAIVQTARDIPGRTGVPVSALRGGSSRIHVDTTRNFGARGSRALTSLTKDNVVFGQLPNPRGHSSPAVNVQPSETHKSLVADDGSTQASSSDGSGKPASVDGKSIASGATFQLDEKESLRPDDSASLRAVEEEEAASGNDSFFGESRLGSESGAHAFGDQLQEILVMAPQRHPAIARTQSNPPSIAFSDSSTHGAALAAAVVPLGAAPDGLSGQLVVEPNQKLLDALESGKDRVWVLKIEQDLIDFLNNPQLSSMFLPQCNSFYRMLAHKLADYYLLGHVPDRSGQAVQVYKTPHSRLPVSLSTLGVRSSLQETPPSSNPARQIMRRGGDNIASASNSEGQSKTTSEAGGDSASDLGADQKSKLTREEREARYREVRLRIFGGTEEAVLVDSGERSAEALSRSSSVSGKKRNSAKKLRNDQDDEFEARSQFNQYYGSSNNATGFGSDGVFYMPYQPMGSPVMPMYGAPYHMMGDAQQGYGWNEQAYQYDLSANFQRGMQAFQNAVPDHLPARNSSVASNLQAQGSQPVQPPWTMPSSYDIPYQGDQQQFVSYPQSQSPPGNMVPISYPYGQLPGLQQSGKPISSQHPIPGSFHRPQFNPQSQPFLPGGTNGYPLLAGQMTAFPPQAQSPNQGTFLSRATSDGSPTPRQPMSMSSHGPANHNSSFRHQVSQTPTPAHTSSLSVGPSGSTLPPVSQHANLPQLVNPESTIAKWGTPSHLPPKPPQPTNPHPQKWMEAHQKQLQMQGFVTASPGLPIAAAEAGKMGTVNGKSSSTDVQDDCAVDVSNGLTA